MKIYVSGSFAARERLRPEAHKLWKAGHEITSSWLDEITQPPSLDEKSFWRKLAIKDLGEIRAADMVIVDTQTQSSTGGLYAELGMAASSVTPKAIWHIGPIKCVFETLADRHFENWD